MLGFIPVEPTHVTIVDFKMELTALVTDADGIKDRAATFHVFQVDESSYRDSLSGFGLKGVPVEQNITTVGISCISTFALRKVHNDGPVLHDAIVGVARGILDYGSLGVIELQMFYEALFYSKEKHFRPIINSFKVNSIALATELVIPLSMHANR